MADAAAKQSLPPAAFPSRPRHVGGLECVVSRDAAVGRHPARFGDSYDAIALDDSFDAVLVLLEHDLAADRWRAEGDQVAEAGSVIEQEGARAGQMA
jgi:hypothetical protein